MARAFVSPPNLPERTGYLFVDLGWLRERGREIYGAEKPISPTGLQQLMKHSSAGKDALASMVRRAYVYDGADRVDRPKSWRHGDLEPRAFRLTENQKALQSTDQIIMRFGRKIGGRQKGVDTRLASDLIAFAVGGQCQVAHVLTNDLDFEEPIEMISDLGLQIVLYDLVEAPKESRLIPELRALADRVVDLGAEPAATLFGDVPRYQVVEGTLDDRTAVALHNSGMRPFDGVNEEPALLISCGKVRGRNADRDARDRGIAYVGVSDVDGSLVEICTQDPGSRNQKHQQVDDPSSIVGPFVRQHCLGP